MHDAGSRLTWNGILKSERLSWSPALWLGGCDPSESLACLDSHRLFSKMG